MAFSHTHSSGWFVPDRLAMPGGELIPDYLKLMKARLIEAAQQAVASAQNATVTYGRGKCDMAANRDYWDPDFKGYTCGYNPDAPADDTLYVARVTSANGKLLAVLANYAAHATSLAWLNSLISPDFAGEIKSKVEEMTGAPGVFVQGCCGDLAPRYGYSGDPKVADRNGLQVALVALSTLEAMDPPLTDFNYTGPVISGATLGTWAQQPFTPERMAETTVFSGGLYSVELPVKERPDPSSMEQELADWEAKQRAADAAGDVIAARDYGARAERARWWLGRLQQIPTTKTYTLTFSVFRMGDAIWVAMGGEPYSVMQQELRRRFPAQTVLVSPLSDHLAVAYLMPRDRYGKGLYQEEPSILGKGCLEILTDAISQRIQTLI